MLSVSHSFPWPKAHFGLFLLAVGASWCATSALAHADGIDCHIYAADYANQYIGSGDPIGDAVRGGMAGAVAGGAWAGESGARRGAQAGGALGVLNNLGSYPGGWQALYDMAYQMCAQQTSGAAMPGFGAPQPIPPMPDCRSRATVNAFSLRDGPGGSITAGSGRTGCR
ncbi:hypothetical protein GCM10011316_11480 [Roseibium aquae]|uniref:Uncharacterized protein n=1 Tax=Roseibium aquae TaxID=1323746 RepID=A0A916TDF9_9HYPH|nr:hypothetical protein [Roseibium aquae]GGB41229.1 hypothetical protein GCM10011316_11480 [Roseibium aquae]